MDAIAGLGGATDAYQQAALKRLQIQNQQRDLDAEGVEGRGLSAWAHGDSSDALSLAALGNASKMLGGPPGGGGAGMSPGGGMQQSQAPSPGTPPQPQGPSPGAKGPPPGMGGPGGMPGSPAPPQGWPGPAPTYQPPGRGPMQAFPNGAPPPAPPPGSVPQSGMGRPPSWATGPGGPMGRPMQAMMPGAPPGGGPGGPMPPPQQSAGGGAPPGGVAGPSSAGGMQRPPQVQQTLNQMGQPQGLNWQQMVKQVFDSNPGVDPATAARAVNKMLPFMNAVSRQEWLIAHNQSLQTQLDAKIWAQTRGQDMANARAQMSAGTRLVMAQMTDARIRELAGNNDDLKRDLEEQREAARAAEGAANRGSREGIAGANRDAAGARSQAQIDARKAEGDANRTLRKDIADARVALTKNSQDLRDPEIVADRGSLATMQKNMDGITAYSNFTAKNGDKLLELAAKVDGTGVPVIDRWVRAGRREIAGDPDVSAFQFQLRSFTNEVGRILTNANITGQLTNQARSEAGEFLNSGATTEQLERVFDTFKTDVDNRSSELAAGVADIKERIAARRQQLSNTPGGQAPAASPTKTPAPLSSGGATGGDADFIAKAKAAGYSDEEIEKFLKDKKGSDKRSDVGTPLKVAGNFELPGDKGPRQLPIRSSKSLQKALDNAEGDEDLLRIKKLLEKRGYDTSFLGDIG